MKIPLGSWYRGTEVDLSPGHIVLDGDPAPPAKGAQLFPLFGPCLLYTPPSHWPISTTAELLYKRLTNRYLLPLQVKVNRFVTSVPLTSDVN